MTEPLLSVQGLTKHFPVSRGVFGRVVGQVRAVDGVSFDIARGETLGLVGESGCGKTTVGRCVLRLTAATDGKLSFDGLDVRTAAGPDLLRLRRELQVVFQDPMSSLNPRMRVIDIVGEAMEVHGIAHGAEIERRVAELLGKVGLSPNWINRYPHEFSGGQRQRIGVARAIALNPKLVVCDEAVSALDVSVQAQVVNLLIQLRKELGLSYLFIAHDLSVVRHVSHRIAVMYLGQIAEIAPAKRLFAAPSHPYTRALLSAIPIPEPGRHKRRLVLAGDVPSPLNPPSGCRFHTRCPAAKDECKVEDPRTIEVESGHLVKCVHAYGLEADPDFYRRLSERIEEASRGHGVAEPVRVVEPLSPAAPEARPEPSRDRPVRPEPQQTPGSPAVGILAVMASLVAILLGAPWTGTALGVASYVLLARPGLADSVRRGDLALACGLVVALFTGAAVRRAHRTTEAREQVARLSSEIADYRRVTGNYPASLDALGWRLYPLFRDGNPVDPWGRPLRYAAPGAEGRPFDLGSTGPDGVPGKDDIGHLPQP